MRYRILIIAFIIGMISGSLSVDIMAQESCFSNPSESYEELDPENLIIYRQFGLSQNAELDQLLEYDPSGEITEAEWEENLEVYIEHELRHNPDIAIFEDLNTCEALFAAEAHANPLERYNLYLIPILGTDRNIGVMSRVAIEEMFSINGTLLVQELHYECSQPYLINFNMGEKNIMILGVYYLFDFHAMERCDIGAFRASQLADTLDEIAMRERAEVIFFGDLNYYNSDNPIQLSELRDRSSTIQRLVESHSKEGIVMQFWADPQEDDPRIDQLLAPVMFSKRMMPAIKRVEPELAISDPLDANTGTFHGEVESITIILDSSQIQDWPFSILWILVVAAFLGLIVFYVILRIQMRRDEDTEIGMRSVT